jgi:NADPH:quinone reductase-like Zn-dependent oxidoreductase
VITTCSARNNDFVTSIGAEKAFDYTSPTCGKDINSYTNNELLYAWDTISLEDSAKICAEALTTDGKGKARYGSILPIKLPDRDDVEVTGTLMYTIFDEAFAKGGRETPRSTEDFESAKTIFELTEELLRTGALKTHPEKVGKDGLKGVLDGMVQLKEGNVRGEKLVYKVDETPNEEGVSQSFA